MTQINKNNKEIDETLIKRIIQALDGLKFGSVLITVHNSKVVQIDRIEKVRFERDPQVDLGSDI